MSAGDDIAELARRYLDEPGSRGLQQVDEQIAQAMGDARWDEMSKWHRVRYRLMRMQQERSSREKLGPAC